MDSHIPHKIAITKRSPDLLRELNLSLLKANRSVVGMTKRPHKMGKARILKKLVDLRPDVDASFTTVSASLIHFVLTVPQPSDETQQRTPKLFEQQLHDQVLSVGWVSLLKTDHKTRKQSAIAFVSDKGGEIAFSHLDRGWLPRALDNAIKTLPKWGSRSSAGEQKIHFLTIPVLRQDIIWLQSDRRSNDIFVRLCPPINSKFHVLQPLSTENLEIALNGAWPSANSRSTVPKRLAPPAGLFAAE